MLETLYLDGVLTAWGWLSLGLGLCIAEMLAPGVFLLWPGIAGLTVGMLVLIVPAIPPTLQWTIFALLSVALVLWWRRHLAENPQTSEAEGLNRKESELVGKITTVPNGIINGRGRIHLGGSDWSVEGEDLPPGSRIKVIGMEGVVLRVEAVDAPPTQNPSPDVP